LLGMPDKPTMTTRISSIIASTDTLLETIHSISSSLRPAMLDELGLFGALEWYVNDFQSRTGIRCNLHLTNAAKTVGAKRKELNTAAYRIIQEAMLNALRHAQANKIDVLMCSRKGKLVISIKDDGIGILAEDLKDKLALGILGMKERASLVGGTATVKGGKNGGTVVTASLPLR
jgi:two-component system, NarL family, sensor histidine kinase UhpB